MRSGRLVFSSLIALCSLCLGGDARGQNLFFEEQDLFVSGAGYNTFRIPSLAVTTRGTLLAFCEGRKAGRGDSGNIDIVMKRSTDLGKTWSEYKVIWDDEGNTCGNPCSVVDRDTGTIWLLLTHNLGVDREPQIIDRTSKGTRTVWVTSSGDDGITWAQPVEITKTTKEPDWTWYATGPGCGLQLRDGALVIPCDHIEAETKRYTSHVFYSRDHGKTWRLGGSVPGDDVNECEAVERMDGSVLLCMRNYNRDHMCRAFSTSKDGGMTWSKRSYEEILIEPLCQASLRRATWENENDKAMGDRPFAGDPSLNRSRILFSNPASREQRVKMTVRLSYDEGATWPVAKEIHTGPSAYSCLASLQDGTFGCLYEKGVKHPYERIALARFDLAWLTAGRDAPAFILAPAFEEIACEGKYGGHLQGIALDENGAIYWSFTVKLVKTDSRGKVLKQVDVPSHHGDLTCRVGKVYVAVNLGKFNEEPGQADSWVYVYNSEDLGFISKHEVREVVHGAGGMGCMDNRFFVIGGLPKGYEENYVYEYDEDFKFIERHEIKSGYTLMGIQTACHWGGLWWFGCYGKKLLVTDDAFELKGKFDVDFGYGVAGLENGRLLRGVSEGRWQGRAVPVHVDTNTIH
jgi:sialidase-1